MTRLVFCLAFPTVFRPGWVGVTIHVRQGAAYVHWWRTELHAHVGPWVFLNCRGALAYLGFLIPKCLSISCRFLFSWHKALLRGSHIGIWRRR